MDIVSMSSNDHATTSYEPRRTLTGSVSPSQHAHRNHQSSTSDLVSPHSTRRSYAPSSRTSPPPATLEVTDMDLSSSTLASTPSGHHSVWRDLHSHPASPTPDGQDHDRMETDDDNQESSSDDDMTIHQDTVPPGIHHLQYDEIMDTTPDEAPSHERDQRANDHHSENVIPSPPQSPPTISVAIDPPPNPTLPDTSPVPSTPHLSQTDNEVGTPALPQAPAVDAATLGEATVDAVLRHDTASTADASGTLQSIDPPSENQPTPAQAPENGNREGIPEQQHGREDDSSQEESSDEEERPYWAEFTEDTSGPDEQELSDIERDGEEVDALDHAHWESKTYEALGDPEHVPMDSGRIAWTVTPVNGTPGNPNREKVMRSPSVLIGGVYWNIKYYPRGNDGTENMSVYIECSSSPDGEADSDEGSDVDASSEPDNGGQATRGVADDNAVPDTQSVPQTVTTTTESSTEAPQQASDVVNADTEPPRVRWEAAAQIGCVVYNPNEPRVNVFQRSSHRFNSKNADWGWTRFHGPWETIHLRQRNERQALLRNDTLVFTAYIRIVKDDTQSLWWHAPKQGAGWESYERIGVKSLACGSLRDNAIIAAISCWLNLRPFVDFIRSMKIPNVLTEPHERDRPLFRALQQLLEYMFEKTEDTDRSAMINCVGWIDWYITETCPPRLDMPDVVAVWESLRRILNFEVSGMGDMAKAPDCFQDVLLLRQPDPWVAEYPIWSNSADAAVLPQPSEALSVQETIDNATSSSTPFQPWQSFMGNSPESDELPAVLSIELHRQKYDKKVRRWDKLVHRVELNDNITYTSPKTRVKCDYTLFGMVIHSGALESQDFYSVIRPQGPGTRWIRYSGGNFHRGAACLTTAQAIAAHEGQENLVTGNAKVAYLVLYVRTDAISDILLPPAQFDELPKTKVQTSSPPGDTDTEAWVPVRVYKSTVFDSHVGRGFPDLWDANPWNAPDSVRDITVPRSGNVEDVLGHLDDDFVGTHQPQKVDGSMSSTWHYIETGLHVVRGLPRFVPLSPTDPLERAIVPENACRLWLHKFVSEGPSTDDERSTSTAIEPVVDTHQTQANVEDHPDGFADAVMTPEEQPQPLPQVEPSDGHDDVQDPSTSTNATISTLQEDNMPSAAPSLPVPPEDSLLSAAPTDHEPEEQDGGEDAVMGGTQELPATTDPDQPGLKRRLKPRIYIFVKIFDSEAQTLRAVCSDVVSLVCNVHAHIKRLLGSDDSFDVYIERSRSLSENDRVRSTRTFEDLGSRDGCILIAHRRPSPDETATLVSQGKHPDPISYFTYLRYHDDPSYLAAHATNNYFGQEYNSCALSFGIRHGQGTMISTNGNAYVGDWVFDQRCGYGTMAYASGDTYMGDFVDDEKEGQGKMVYGKTSNVYEGGWKKGRRHGKGVMTYEVADEDIATCKICFENEMDALFYDCGHVAACEECARQVEICP
ncbi:MAG: hypothetical protein Q9197_004347, partial [Variospora fuerteventurae]